jgi:hypothetical protein
MKMQWHASQSWLVLLLTCIIVPVEHSAADDSPSIALTALSSVERVLEPTGGAVEGSESAAIRSARNETESFQVVITATGQRLTNVQVEVSDLTSEEGAVIKRDRIRLFREVYTLIRDSSPEAPLAPGPFPDALVPFTNPYTDEPISEERFRSQGYDLWEGHHQPIWVDVSVPVDAAPGVYSGEVRVEADNGELATIPVKLTVWDFTLPDGPTHSSHFGGFGRLAGYYETSDNAERRRTLEMRYIEMVADHRINPPLPSHLHPHTNDDGTIHVDERFDRKFTEFIERFNVTDIEVPLAPANYPTSVDEEAASNFYRSWYDYLERKGWEDRAYLYLYDEPNSPEQYRRVRELAATAESAAPDLRRLVVEQPYSQDPEWGTLNEATDIWCPLFGFIHEPSIQEVQRQGDEVWSYTALVQDAPSYIPNYEEVREDDPPYWEIDFPLTSYRIPTWLNRRYGITGLLYWTMVQWSSDDDRNFWYDPAFSHGGAYNGGGQLLYPGDEVGIEGPVASIRLKALRDGMEDYEYFALLEKRGEEQMVEDAVREMVPTWGSWKRDPELLLEHRRKLGEALSR